VVDRLKNLDVQLLSRWRVKGHTQCHEGVRESLHADPNGTVAEVGTAGLRDRIVVHVDDSVEIESNHFRHVVELGEIVLPVGDEGRECYGGKIANRNLVGGWIFNDLRAEVGWFDGAEILLIRFRYMARMKTRLSKN
jgi:hypothetical protein